MVTGPEKYRKYIAGHMIMEKMEEISSRKLSLLVSMKVNIDPSP
jgi:hypothetical protein